MRLPAIFKRRETAWRQLVDDLERLGFYMHADLHDVTHIKEDALQREFLFDGATGRGTFSWGLAAGRFGLAINALLADSVSVERLYTLNGGGNEGMAVFLAPEMFDLIAQSPLIEDKENPENPASLFN
jgi:hypothetical protein